MIDKTKIKEFDTVLLKDGREASIVEVFGDGEEFLADIGDSPATWETISVFPEDIEKVINE